MRRRPRRRGRRAVDRRRCHDRVVVVLLRRRRGPHGALSVTRSGERRVQRSVLGGGRQLADDRLGVARGELCAALDADRERHRGRLLQARRRDDTTLNATIWSVLVTYESVATSAVLTMLSSVAASMVTSQGQAEKQSRRTPPAPAGGSLVAETRTRRRSAPASARGSRRAVGFCAARSPPAPGRREGSSVQAVVVGVGVGAAAEEFVGASVAATEGRGVGAEHRRRRHAAPR